MEQMTRTWISYQPARQPRVGRKKVIAKIARVGTWEGTWGRRAMS